jgi:hypothetical protein
MKTNTTQPAVEIKVVAHGTGFVEFTVGGYQACAFSVDGSVVLSGPSNDGRSKVPDFVRRAGRKVLGR